jgi:predicted transcriptional regulator
LYQALKTRLDSLQYYDSAIKFLPYGNDKKYYEIYFLLVQAALFSENGITTKELLDNTELSRSTLTKRLNQISKTSLLDNKTISKEKHYQLNLNLVDKIISESQKEVK